MATYHYTASAVALGGVLNYDKNGTRIVRSLASVALAPTGGEGFGELTDYDSDGISFSKASSHVTGYSAGRTFTTRSDVYVTDLNLFGRVRAASLQTTISSTRELLASATLETENPDKALFSMSSLIVGLTIDGVEVTPEFDLALCKCATYAEVGKVYAKRRLAMPPAHAQLIRTSFVKDLLYAPTDTVGPRQGFKVPVENFGTVHIGEMIVKPGTRTVNLLRIEFDAALRLPQRARASTRRRQSQQTANAEAAEVSAIAAEVTQAPPDGGTMTMLSLHGNGVPSWP